MRVDHAGQASPPTAPGILRASPGRFLRDDMTDTRLDR